MCIQLLLGVMFSYSVYLLLAFISGREAERIHGRTRREREREKRGGSGKLAILLTNNILTEWVKVILMDQCHIKIHLEKLSQAFPIW